MRQDQVSVEAMTELQPQTTAYRSDSSLSKRLYQRAVKVMPGGNTRHSTVLSPYPIYVSRGQGCHVTDVEGQERLDFLNNYTSLILGHANPRVTQAVQQRVASSTAFTMPTEVEVELAELIVSRVSYIDQMRFCNSGSEAVMMAVRVARAFTGRPKIAKFEGAYHGVYDYVQVSEGRRPAIGAMPRLRRAWLNRASRPAWPARWSCCPGTTFRLAGASSRVTKRNWRR